jgi:hypothetical protein
VLLREKIVRAEIAAAKLGIHEVGFNNHGPEVKKFLAEVGLPEGYPWCDAFQSYEEHAAAGHRLPIESASVAQTWAEAKKFGWTVERPRRGDFVLYDFDGDGQADDHIGIVVRVIHLATTPGPLEGKFILQTVEGNTSSGRGGSQTDGGGVYLRRRVVKASSVRLVRIPNDVK